MKRVFGTAFGDYFPALGLSLFTAAYLYLSYQYPEKARAFPAKIAWVMLALLALDLLSRTQTRLGMAVLRALNPAEARGGHAQSAWRQVSAVLWIAGFTVAIVLIGIVSAVPLYVFAAIRFRGGRSYPVALATAAGATLFVYLLFGVVLRLDLYPGMFFNTK